MKFWCPCNNPFLFLVSGVAAFLWLASLRGEDPVESVVRQVAFEQRLNAQLPLEISFRDETGVQRQLDAYFGQKPVVLSLVYYECPMLCNLVLNGLLRCLRALPMDVGGDFEVLTVSFDPGETPQLAAAKKKSYIEQYGREGGQAGWHFLTGEEAAIRELTETVGFSYAYDAETDQYAHASGILVLTPEGKVSRYFYGVEFSARDLRLALVEASEKKIGTVVDQVLLLCLQYDPTTGKYGLVIMSFMRLAGIATVSSLVLFIVFAVRRERQKEAARAAGGIASRSGE